MFSITLFQRLRLKPGNYESVTRQRRAYFIYALSLISLVGIIGNLIIDIYNIHIHGIDILFLFCLLAYYLATIIYVRKDRIEIAAAMIAIVGGIGYFLFAYGDSLSIDSMFLFTTYPILAFFLLGKRTGVWWVFGFFFAMLGFYALSLTKFFYLSWTFKNVMELAFAYGVTVLMVYVYQDTIDASERLIRIRDDELADERDQAAAVVTSIGEGAIVIDSHSGVLSMNPVAEQLLSVTAKHVMGKPITTVLHLVYKEEGVAHKDHPATIALRQKKAVSTSMKDGIICKTNSGAFFPVSIVATPIHRIATDGGGVVIFRDITSEKAAASLIEQKVDEGKAQLLSSINSLELGYVMTDSDSSIVLVNKAVLSIIERTGVGKLPHKPNLGDLETIFKKSLNLSSEIKKCLGERRNIDIPDVALGALFIKLFISPILIKDEVIGTVVILQDITEAKILQRSRDEFFALASHELRTPVAIIRGYLDSLRSSFHPLMKNEDAANKMRILQLSAERLRIIINDFLDLSRLEQNRITFRIEHVEIVPIIETAIEESSLLIRGKKVELKLIVEPNTSNYVFADKERVRQIILNLISNAAKFTEKGHIIIRLSNKEGALLVEVEDSGKGISLQSQSLLFHKFQQAADSFLSREVSGSGTGLGLYISKLLIEGMGGTIYLEASVVNKGSVFAITLPIIEPE